MGNTTNRNYPKPVPANAISDDVFSLINAFDMIDTDVAALVSGLAGKAPSSHTHTIANVTGLQTALDGKSATTHSHALDDLSDVSGTAGAATGFVLVKGSTDWVPASPASALGAHSHVIGDVTNLQAALDSKIAFTDLTGASTKTTPVDADTVPLNDSAASNAIKKLTWANVKATLKTYFDSLYASASFGVQTGTIHEFAGSTAPSGYFFCDGSAVSRTAEAALFAVIGTAYGVGDGSTTFNLPDKRGRVAVGRDDMGGTGANRLGATLTGTRASTANGIISGLSSTVGLAVGMVAFGTGIGAAATIASIDSATQVTLSVNNTATGSAAIRFAVIDGNTLGAAGGAAAHTLTIAQMPAHTHTITALNSRNTSLGGSETIADTSSNTTMTTNSTGGGQAHPIVQPSIVMNFIIKR